MNVSQGMSYQVMISAVESKAGNREEKITGMSGGKGDMFCRSGGKGDMFCRSGGLFEER